MGVSFDFKTILIIVVEVVVVITAIAVIVKFWKMVRRDPAFDTQGNELPQDAQIIQSLETEETDVSEEDKELLSAISLATSFRDLVGIADKKFFNDAQSAAFLEKILPYDKLLCADDWDPIFWAAAVGSELENLAEERLEALLYKHDEE